MAMNGKYRDKTGEIQGNIGELHFVDHINLMYFERALPYFKTMTKLQTSPDLSCKGLFPGL